jgi:hypothetical protein
MCYSKFQSTHTHNTSHTWGDSNPRKPSPTITDKIDHLTNSNNYIRRSSTRHSITFISTSYRSYSPRVLSCIYSQLTHCSLLQGRQLSFVASHHFYRQQNIPTPEHWYHHIQELYHILPGCLLKTYSISNFLDTPTNSRRHHINYSKLLVTKPTFHHRLKIYAN